MFFRASLLLALSFLALAPGLPVVAEVGAPVPGEELPPESLQVSAPVPGQPFNQWPTAAERSLPTPAAQPALPFAYHQLPVSLGDAQARLEELKGLLPQCRPKDLQEPIYRLCEWLSDMTEAHNKLASTFAKHDSTRAQAEVERRAGQKFAQLKNQSLLLKADLLIGQQRYQEALEPLMAIVVAEPRSATGQSAYRRLREIGFAGEIELAGETKPQARPAVAPSAARNSLIKPPNQPLARVGAPAVSIKPRNLPQTRAARAAPASSSERTFQPLWFTGSPAGAPAGGSQAAADSRPTQR